MTQIQSALSIWCRVNGRSLNEVCFLYQLLSVVSKSIPLIPLYTWKVVNGIKLMLAALFCRCGHFYNWVILAFSFVSGTFCLFITIDSFFHDSLLPALRNYHINPTEVATDTPIPPNCFSETYYTVSLIEWQLSILSPFPFQRLL